MEKERNAKIIAIVALFIAVIGISIGFATFSRTFNITSTDTTTVKQGEDVFATGLYLTATDGTITDQTTWSGLTGEINASSRTITYTATINNTTSYDAYLKSISSNSGTLICTAIDVDNTNDSIVQAACDKLTLNVEIGNYIGTITKAKALSESSLNNGSYTVSDQSTEEIILTLTLADDAIMPDGDFKVTIPGITFDYTSLKTNQ